MFNVRKLSVATLLVILVAGLVPLIAASPASAAGGFAARVNFQQQTWPTPTGYSPDWGLGYTATASGGTGYGWVAAGTQTPVTLAKAQAKRRLSIGDGRLGSLITVPNTAMPNWQQAVPNGTYDVTVSVGDRYFGAKATIKAEGTPVITNWGPSALQYFKRATTRVTVADGFLTLDFTGSNNAPVNYVEINEVTASTPSMNSVTPANGASGIDVTASVIMITSFSVDANALTKSTVQIIDLFGNPVLTNINTDAAGGVVSITPQNRLLPFTTYTIETNAGLKDLSGNSFTNVTATFVTGETGLAVSPGSFDRFTLTTLNAPTVMQIGPDGRLYVATGAGELHAYTLAVDPLTGSQIVTADQALGPWTYQRTILGLAFDPRSTPANPILWVSHGAIGDLQANFTGTVSVLDGPGLANVRDVVVGLPRSCHDHMNNGISFGPDGKLYLAQGAMTGYGAPDPYWCNLSETPLSAAVLQMDVVNDARFAGTVDVNTSATNSTGTAYDPSAVGAPLTTYAIGTRNPYSLVWHSNGTLYAPVNESAGGNSPAGPGGNPPALTSLPDYHDFLAKVLPGKYYGHPNPSVNRYVLNGGNPTAGVDPYEVTQYPVGVLPEADYQQPALDLGAHRSADGMKEYTSHQFNNALFGNLLVAEFSNGDDVVSIKLDANGDVANISQLASGFNNPIDVAVDSAGGVFVAEFGNMPDGNAGQITYLKPSPGLDCSTPAARINFQPTTAPVPGGYIGDDGNAFDPTTGYGWVTPGTSTPFDITGRGIDRNVASDQRIDTFINMNAPSGAAWEWTIPDPNVRYRVSVSVGDANSFTNQTDVINVEGSALINAFVPTSTNRFATGTVVLSAGQPADGKITIDAIGGTNTKINYVNIDKCIDVPIDTTPPTVTISLAGTPNIDGTWVGPVTATVAADDGTGTGVRTIQYRVDGGPFTNYGSPVTISGNGPHTITATASDNAFNDSTPVTQTFTIDPNVPLVDFTSPYDSLGNGPRLVFSTVGEDPQFPAQTAQVVNTGVKPLTVTNLSFGGVDAADFQLGAGQITSFVLAPGQQQAVAVAFRPFANSYPIRSATLVVTSNAPTMPTASMNVAGLDPADFQGGNEPHLKEILQTVGFTNNPTLAPGQTRIADREEVISPFWTAVDTTKPVTVTPIARYESTTTFTSGQFGWYPKGAASSGNVKLFDFAGGTTQYGGENQKLFPQISPGSITSFTPAGTFGLVRVNSEYSDDGRNGPQAWHNFRFYPAKDINGNVQPNTWIVGQDRSNIFVTPADKNFDYQDVVAIMTNAQPEFAAAASLGTTGVRLDFNAAVPGTIADATGQGTGFTSVEPNTAGNQYNPALINLDTANGVLKLTSTSGSNSAKINTQTNQLRVNFNASERPFTLSTRLVGPFTNITLGRQQEALYYGWNQDNFIRLEIENTGGVPNVLMYLENQKTPTKFVNKVLAGPFAVPGLTTASTFDLFLTVDPAAGTFTPQYRMNSNLPTDIVSMGGPYAPTVPATIMSWVSPSMYGGVSVSNRGTSVPIMGTFDWFEVK